MNRRDFLSTLGSASVLSLSPSVSDDYHKTREAYRCVFSHDDYITGIRFHKFDPPYLKSCDPDEATRCIYTSTHLDYIKEVGGRLDYPTELKASEFDIYMNLVRRGDGFLVAQRGMGSASQGKEHLGWE